MKIYSNDPPVIEEIKLENFQSLRDPVEIPIKPLTFLYGPNSAGKSAICDSLIFVDAFLNGSTSEITGYLERWQHIDKMGGDLKPLSVEIKFLAPKIFSESIGNVNSAEVLPLEILGKNGFFTFTEESPGRINLSVSASGGLDEIIRKFCLSIDGLPILEIESFDGDENFEPRLKLFKNIFGETLSNLAERHGFDGNDPLTFVTHCWIRTGPFRIEPGIGVGGSHDFDRDLISIANYFINDIVGLSFTPNIIEADRGVISNNLLSVICTFSGDVEDVYINGVFENSGKLGFEPISNQSTDGASDHLSRLSTGIIGSLVLSRAREEVVHRVRYACEKRPEIISGLAVDGSSSEFVFKELLHSFVNRCLSDHLFIDQGYQISYEIREILPSQIDILTDQLPQVYDKKNGEKRFLFSFLIICSLRDKSGRSVTFEDVGTGISCVLPVVAALDSRSSFIQQPELHLHPALQSAAGDICIEAIKKHEQSFHIIETHSEYLLLRCLRRIRETTSGRILENDLISLSSNDISVLYFDPQDDGSTKVKRLRVSSQGEFIDRWPRGFFEERGKDLFDE